MRRNRTPVIGLACAMVAASGWWCAWAQEPGVGLRLGDGAEEGSDGPSLSRGFTPDLPESNTQTQLARAFELLQVHEYEAAGRILQGVLDRNPDDRRAWIGLSTVHFKQYRYAEAVEILERLIVQYPEDAALKNNAAWMYATTTDPEVRDGRRAVELARQALVDAPGSYHIWSTAAEGYYVTGEFEKALSAASEAMLMGLNANAESDNLREYRAQIQKARLAVQAMTLME